KLNSQSQGKQYPTPAKRASRARHNSTSRKVIDFRQSTKTQCRVANLQFFSDLRLDMVSKPVAIEALRCDYYTATAACLEEGNWRRSGLCQSPPRARGPAQ